MAVDATTQAWTARRVDLLARQLGADSIRATTSAGSGHPTSSLSAAHLVATLLTRHLKLDLDDPGAPRSDRLVMSKGHAAPLLYAALAALGVIGPEELDTLRQEGSPLEGHPVPRLPLIETATGSLGQGLSVGLGMALALRRLGSDALVWVILGDSEMSEGSVWEAFELARQYEASRLRAVLDMNRLGQTGPTMHGWDTEAYRSRASAFGWNTAGVDGHDPDDISSGLDALDAGEGPGLLIARTEKGHGVSFLADQPGRHGKPLDDEEAAEARGELDPPERIHLRPEPAAGSAERPGPPQRPEPVSFSKPLATRAAFGEALAAEAAADPHLVVLDAEVGNSTMTEEVARQHPDNFVQAYIAEQAMVGVANGMQAVGLRPVVSTFAAFLTRAHDFFRMAAIGRASLVVNGSHAGVSIGEDGPSQMGLDDIAMMRGLPGSTVLYPADANSTSALLRIALESDGISYLRTTRESTPVLYGPEQRFRLGGCHVLRSFQGAVATVIGAGVTVHEALQAADTLAGRGVEVGVIDAYSVQPIDGEILREAMAETGRLVVVEDHGAVGGLGDSVLDALAGVEGGVVTKLAVTGLPGSAPPQRQRQIHGISAEAIVEAVTDGG